MDSGSGSLQSSSGGDEEYDSHHQPQLFPPPPLFFNNNILPPPPLSSSSSTPASSSIPHQHQQQQPLPNFHYQNHLLHPPPFYDFPSNYNFNPDSSNSFVNLDVLRSEPTHFKNPSGSTHNQIPIRSTPSSSGALHPKVTTKKRTRASRRAPTTVLTTDTTNFRAMVQEFTGIPSPPFTAAGGSSYSRRFDLFGLVRTSNSTATSVEGSGLGLYPCRSKEENVVQQAQAEAGGIFSFQSLSAHEFNSNSKEVTEGSRHLETPHNIHGSTTSQQLLSAALQNDETWRTCNVRTATTATAATATATPSNNNNNAANCKFNFTASSSSNNLGNIVSTTRGESTVDSWISPSE